MPFTRSQTKQASMAELSDTGVRPTTTSEGDHDDRDSERSTVSELTRSAASVATIRARKLAAEARVRRRQLERERELAEQHEERERELVALEKQVEEDELRAELAAIEAESAASCGSLRSRHSSRRLTNWVNDVTKRSQVNDFVHIPEKNAIKQIDRTIGTSDQSQVLQPTVTQAIAHTSNLQNELRTHYQEIAHERAADQSQQPVPTLSARATHNHVPQIEVLQDLVTIQNNTPLFPNDVTGMIRAIADTASATRALVVSQTQPRKPQHMELPQYFGNPSHWLQFKRIYDTTKSLYSPLENVNRLQQALRGAARDSVASLLLSAEAPEDIIRLLEHNFARPELIVFHEVASLRNLANLTLDLKGLPSFSSKVRNSVATIKLLEQNEYLHSPELFYSILNKLNYTLRMRWTDFASDNQQNKCKLELLSDFLVRELERHIKFGLSPDCLPSTSSKSFTTKPSGRTDISVHAIDDSKNKNKCIYCSKIHGLKDCSGFKLLSIEDRWRWLRIKKMCYRCLKGSAHTWNTCKAPTCGVDGCTRRHHALLHGSAAQPSSQPQIEEVVGLSTAHPTRSCSTLLKIVPVTVSGPAGSYDTYALLDDGSTATLIDSAVANEIGVTGPSDLIKINAIGGMNKNMDISYVSFDIKGKYTHETFNIKNARAINSLTLYKQTIKYTDISKFNHLCGLIDMLTYTDAVPTILIGAEDWHLSITREVRKGHRSDPVACLTALGWVLYGIVGRRTKPIIFINHTLCTNLNDNEQVDSLEFLIKEQYKLDSIGICKRDKYYNSDDQRALDILNATTKRLPSGRFIVGLPWRHESTTVPNSYYQAESRLKSLEKRMAKDSAFAESYRTYMTDMVNKGYAEECSVDTYHTNNTSKGVVHFANSSPRWYLPHFGVYHPQKKKLRVVHDAAAKTYGVSLNTLLLPGPDLLQSLLGILFRFREGRIALTADIKEMFPQVRIRSQDRDALRYLWRPDPQEPIKEFRMTSVIFGACASPFIAQYVKNRNAENFAQLYPAATAAVVHDHYMDDYIGSFDSVSEAATMASDIIAVHKAACFEMRDWISNDRRALKLVPEDLRADTTLQVSLGISVRTLGIIWYPKNDNISFRSGLHENFLSQNIRLTKRQTLSQLMRIYDPLGLLAPFVVKGRIMFQALWRSNVGWDDPLSSVETDNWQVWFKELSAIASVHIPRCYLDSDIFERELHMFCDASELAYACVAYWRFFLSDGSVKLALIGSKSRVTPLKPVSIPRLELQAALIASRLAVTIIKHHKNKPTRVFYWSDSQTVLSWLRSDARAFRPFVAHRVGEIIENTSVNDWRWVPTDLNVADDATRIRPIESSSRWFVGPSFLLNGSEMWPTEPTTTFPPVLTELKTTNVSELVGYTAALETLPMPITAHPEHFSVWTRLVRATARAHQAATKFRQLLATRAQNSKFRSNVFCTSSNNPSVCNPSYHRSLGLQPLSSTTLTELPALTTDLMKTAEEHILRRCQLDSFSEDLRCILASQSLPKKSPLLKLSPSLGKDKVLRLAGRIHDAPNISEEARSPILLDGRHPVARLLIHHYHKIMAHGNNETVVNEIRQKYWMLRLRPTVRTVAKKCLFCRIRKTLPLLPPTADLPAERLAHHQRPFSHVGLDYFGPLVISIGRRREKRYVALYTCLTVRALHLEIVHSLSTDSAIMSLRRFIARRGSPSTIISDNGTAFVGANNELNRFFGSHVTDFAATRGITWKFIPPAAPFFGGCWERLVRSTKTALRATLHQKTPKEETLYTLLMEVEAIVNSRPLSHVAVGTEDLEALTPFHFLIGQSSPIATPSPTLTDSVLVGRSEWQKASRLADHFWSRWVREVLPLLHTRPPAPATLCNVNIGDVVIIADDSMPRGVWPKGRITQLHPGRDGIVRVVDVATKGGVLRRPLKKIINIM